MSLNITDPETDRLARDLAKKTGESITVAIRKALEERLQRETTKSPVSMTEQIMEISERAASYRVRDHQSPEEILGYDKSGSLT